MSDRPRYHLFSNGTEFMVWDAINCCRCANGATVEQYKSGEPLPCDIQNAISGAIVSPDAMTDALARRLGCDERGYAPEVCGEFKDTARD